MSVAVRKDEEINDETSEYVQEIQQLQTTEQPRLLKEDSDNTDITRHEHKHKLNKTTS